MMLLAVGECAQNDGYEVFLNHGEEQERSGAQLASVIHSGTAVRDGAEHDDGNGGCRITGLELSADIKAIAIRQVDIQDDEVGMVGRFLQGLRRGPCLNYVETGFFEGADHEVAVRLVIVDGENRGVWSHGAGFYSRTAGSQNTTKAGANNRLVSASHPKKSLPQVSCGMRAL